MSKVAFNQAVDSVRAGGRVVAVGLPSEMMELSIVKTVLDGIKLSVLLLELVKTWKKPSNSVQKVW